MPIVTIEQTIVFHDLQSCDFAKEVSAYGVHSDQVTIQAEHWNSGADWLEASPTR
jgi:hypothetical protein